MQNLLEDLTKLLDSTGEFTDENGNLLKNKIIENALKLDPSLLKLLLKNKSIKKHFFTEIDGIFVFDKIKFQNFVSNKQFLPDSYTAFKNKIGLVDESGDYISAKKDVALVWPYKDCVLEGGQEKEDQKRDEIFWNETLAPDEIDRLLDPKVLTNWKMFDEKGEHILNGSENIDFNISNLIIKGNNLLVMYSLLDRFKGKVKIIYIDPPYNTGDDGFCYNDSFNHSTWLTFIKNRLLVAKELLSSDGIIFIQINDIEEAYLKVLCDEIFSRECFHTSICVQMSHLSGVKMAHKSKKLPKIKEYILFYTKNKKINLVPQYIPASWDDALERYSSVLVKNGYSENECSKWQVISLAEAIKEAGIKKDDEKAVLDFKLKNANIIFRTARNRGADYSQLNPNEFTKIDNPDGTYYFVYKGEDVSFAAEKVIELNGKLTPVVALGDIWTDIGINNLSNEGGVDLRFGKKPEKLIERLIRIVSTSESDIILDFFAGSGTTGAVAHKLKRQYILVEQLDKHIIKSINRVKNVIQGEQSGSSKENNWKGGGYFIYCELMQWNEIYMEKIKNAKNTNELKKLWKEISQKAFYNYFIDIKKINENISDFEQLSIEDQRKFLIETLDKNHLYINHSEIKDTDFQVKDIRHVRQPIKYSDFQN